MTKVSDVLNALEALAPLSYKMDFDNVGLLAGDPSAEVSKVLLSLDITRDVVSEASSAGAELIVSHHPIMFQAKSIIAGDPQTGKIFELIRSGISAVCMHTNLDSAVGGVNDALAEAVGLINLEPLERAGEDEKGIHGIGRIGTLPEKTLLSAYLPKLKAALNTNGLRYYDSGRPVSRVAVGGGSCGGYLALAAELGCDTFLTADVKYDVFLEAKERGMNIVDGDHFCTENVVIPRLFDKIKRAFPELEVSCSKVHSQTAMFFV